MIYYIINGRTRPILSIASDIIATATIKYKTTVFKLISAIYTY